MDLLVSFEESLFCEQPTFCKVDIANVGFWVNRLVSLPSFRPLFLDQCVGLCKEYIENRDFRKEFLEQSVMKCPVLLYRLFLFGVYEFKEIEPLLNQHKCYLACFYFRSSIIGFEEFMEKKTIPIDFDEPINFFDDQLENKIQYGFIPSSIEYCLKYDDIDTLMSILQNNGVGNDGDVIWSPFEWCLKPESFDYLSVSGLFGSIYCFKYLLLNGYSVDEMVIQNVIFGGKIDIIHQIIQSVSDFGGLLTKAAESCHFDLVKFFMEKGVDLKDESIEALHYSSMNGHISIVKFLLCNGSNINSKDSEFFMIEIIGHHFIMHLLKDKFQYWTT